MMFHQTFQRSLVGILKSDECECKELRVSSAIYQSDVRILDFQRALKRLSKLKNNNYVVTSVWGPGSFRFCLM